MIMFNNICGESIPPAVYYYIEKVLLLINILQFDIAASSSYFASREEKGRFLPAGKNWPDSRFYLEGIARGKNKHPEGQ